MPTRLARSFASLPLVLLLASCAHAPSVPPARPVPSPPLVHLPPPQPDDSAYLRLRHLPRLTQWLGLSLPFVDVVAQSFRPDEPVVLLVQKLVPGGDLSTAPAALWVPAPPSEALVQALSGAGAVRTVGEGSHASLEVLRNDPTLTPLPDGRSPLQALAAAASMSDDAELYLNVAALLAGQEKPLAKLLDQMQAQARASTLPPERRLAAAYVGEALTWAETLRSAALALTAPPRPEIDLLLTQNPTTGATPKPGEALSLPDLAPYLPVGPSGGDGVRLEYCTAHLDELLRWVAVGLTPLLDQHPESATELRQLLDALGRAPGRVHLALAGDFGAKDFGQTGILLGERTAKTGAEQRVTIARVVALLVSPALQEAWRGLGFQLHVAATHDARKVAGWPVDEYVFRVDRADKSATPAGVVGQPLRLEVLRVGAYLLYAFHAPEGTVDRMAAALLARKPLSTPLQARADHPAGARFYADLDLVRLRGALSGVVSEQQLVPITRALPLVTVDGTSEGDTTQLRLRAPQAAH